MLSLVAAGSSLMRKRRAGSLGQQRLHLPADANLRRGVGGALAGGLGSGSARRRCPLAGRVAGAVLPCFGAAVGVGDATVGDGDADGTPAEVAGGLAAVAAKQAGRHAVASVSAGLATSGNLALSLASWR